MWFVNESVVGNLSLNWFVKDANEVMLAFGSNEKMQPRLPREQNDVKCASQGRYIRCLSSRNLLGRRDESRWIGEISGRKFKRTKQQDLPLFGTKERDDEQWMALNSAQNESEVTGRQTIMQIESAMKRPGEKRCRKEKAIFDNELSEKLGGKRCRGMKKAPCLDSSIGELREFAYMHSVHAMYLQGNLWKLPLVNLHESGWAIFDSRVPDLWKLWTSNPDHDSTVVS